MEVFRVFSPLHVTVLMLIGTLTAIAIAIRRRRSTQPWDTGPVERGIAIWFVLLWAGTFAALRVSRTYDPAVHLPLQMCHLCAIAAAIALVRPWRALRAVAYFCGLGLCTQALLTPSLTEGPALFPFWSFWIAHGLVLGVPIYDVAARGYRPVWRDFGYGCAAALAYVAIVLPLDMATGWNYGFLGPSKPDTPSIVDLLGAWPQRLAIIVVIAAAAMFVCLVPWLLVGKRSLPHRSPA